MIPKNKIDFSSTQLQDFVISDYTNLLTSSDIRNHGRQGKYICPNCGKHQLSINKDGFKYDCYGCHDTSAIASQLLQQANELKKKEYRPSVKPQRHEWFYTDQQGNKLIKVRRVDDEVGKKSISQYSKQGNQWISGLKDISQSDVVLLYYQEVQKAIAESETIFITEGELCVDVLRDIGLTATTNIGGSGKNYHVYECLRDYLNVVICPDRDSVGIKHALKINEILPQAKWLYAFPEDVSWKIPLSGGADVADWIDQMKKKDQLTQEEIKNKILCSVETRRENIIYSARTQKKAEKQDNKTTKLRVVEKDWDTAKLSIENLIGRNLNESQLQDHIIQISEETFIAPKELYARYYKLINELEADERLEENTDKLANILEIEKTDLNLFSVLPKRIANQITELAAKMCVTPEHLFTALLPTWSTGIGTKSKIIVSQSMGYTQPAVLRTMIVAKSGDRKTPILNSATQPIEDIELESRLSYQKAKELYEKDLQAWERMSNDERQKNEEPQEPLEERFLLKDFNHDGLVRILSENPQGVLGVIDELKGYFTRMNKSGRGDDEQKDLELFNGKSISKDRMGKDFSFFVPKTAVSLTGTIQWEVLQNLIKSKGDNDSAGTICRWLVCAKEMPKSYLNIFETETSLFDDFKATQKSLFQFLRSLPENDYLLSPEAKKLWQDFQHKLEDMRQAETIEALAIAYPKFESYMSRIALVYHCLESFGQGKPQATISAKTMAKAIETVQWFVGQYKLVLAKLSPTQSLTGDILKIRDFLLKKEMITASQVKDRLKHLRTKDGNQIIKSHFETLVNSGIATWVKSRTLKIKLVTPETSEITPDNSGKSSETLESNQLNSLTKSKKNNSGNSGNNSGQLKSSHNNALDTNSGQNSNSHFSFQFKEKKENLSSVDQTPEITPEKINSPLPKVSEVSSETFEDRGVESSEVSPELSELNSPKQDIARVGEFPELIPELSKVNSHSEDLSHSEPSKKNNQDLFSVNDFPQLNQKYTYRLDSGKTTTVEVKSIKDSGEVIMINLCNGTLIHINEYCYSQIIAKA